MNSFVTDTQALVKFMVGKKVINDKAHQAFLAADKGEAVISTAWQTGQNGETSTMFAVSFQAVTQSRLEAEIPQQSSMLVETSAG